jgi:hypothetical protein
MIGASSRPSTGGDRLPNTIEVESAFTPGEAGSRDAAPLTASGLVSEGATFGTGEVSAFGGSLSFVAALPDGRRFGVVISPDEQQEGPSAANGFGEHHGHPITPALVRKYLPVYAAITWRAAQPTFFGRTEERGTNGKFRVGLLAGGEGPDAATPAEMQGWFAAKVYGLAL